jgi:dihydrofolate reductase
MSHRALAYTLDYPHSPKHPARPFKMIIASDMWGTIGDSSTDGLPWRCKADLVRFKAMTMGNIMVIGVKTFLGLIKTWPGHHVLKGRDVAVVFGIDSADYKVIDAECTKLLEAPGKAWKKFGDRLFMFPAPRKFLSAGIELNSEELAAYRAELKADLLSVALSDQEIYIAGGAGLNELMLESCDTIDYTVIKHNNNCEAPVKMGLKVMHAINACQRINGLGTPKLKFCNWDEYGFDDENDSKCWHFIIKRPIEKWA